jgi:membrane protein
MAGPNAGLSAPDSMPDGRPGQRPADPREAITRRASRMVVAVLRKWDAVDGSRLAAAIAFYSMLSLAPFLLLVVAVGNWWLGTDTAAQYLSSRIEDLIGADAARLVERLVQSRDMLPSTHRFGAQVGTLITIVGATAAYAELQHAFNRIFGEVRRPAMLVLLRARALSFALVIATGFLLVCSLGLSLGVAMLVNHETRIFGVGVSAIVNEVAMFAVIAVVFAALLRVLPDLPPRGRDAWLGALSSAALFAASKFALGAYVARYAVNSTYGAVGTAIAIMLWIYFAAAILLVGAVITSVTMAPPARRTLA